MCILHFLAYHAHFWDNSNLETYKMKLIKHSTSMLLGGNFCHRRLDGSSGAICDIIAL